MSQSQWVLISWVLWLCTSFKDQWAAMVMSPLHAFPKRPWNRWRGTCMPGQVGEEGICTLPHNGWEVYHQTAVKGVPSNPFWSMWSPKEFFSSCNAVWVALLVLPSCCAQARLPLSCWQPCWDKGYLEEEENGSVPHRYPRKERGRLPWTVQDGGRLGEVRQSWACTAVCVS